MFSNCRIFVLSNASPGGTGVGEGESSPSFLAPPPERLGELTWRLEAMR